MCVCIYIYWQHFFVNTNFVEHNRYFLSTYFLLDPFVMPYCFYRIPRELIHVLSIVVYIPSTWSLEIIPLPRWSFAKNNVIYQFKCPLGDCISDNNNMYVGSTSITLSKRLTMHLSYPSSIAQVLKKHSCPAT